MIRESRAVIAEQKKKKARRKGRLAKFCEQIHSLTTSVG
jgi:hypothetical protein